MRHIPSQASGAVIPFPRIPVAGELYGRINPLLGGAEPSQRPSADRTYANLQYGTPAPGTTVIRPALAPPFRLAGSHPPKLRLGPRPP